MLLIAGDSWGLGEWSFPDRSKSMIRCVTHSGLAQYIHESGQTIINLSKPGGSNFESTDSVSNFLFANQNLLLTKEKISAILVFQTEWTRDCTNSELLNQPNLNFDYPLIAQQNISKFYYNLSDISKLYNVPVYVIGGCSDAICLDKFSIEYPGVDIICQSLVNLLVTNDHRIADPVYSFFLGEMCESFIVNIKKNSTNSALELLLNDIDKGKNRLNLFKEYPEYFRPDGGHANRFGHKILFEFLQDSLPNFIIR
jgi:hypothetical protein